MRKEFKFTPNQETLDVLGALICGFLVGAFMGWSRSSGDVYSVDFITSVVVVTGAYLVVALILIMWMNSSTARWILIPIIGSVISFVIIVLIPNQIAEWKFSQHLGFPAYVFTQLEARSLDLALSVLVDNLIALPIMAILHYFPVIRARLLREKVSTRHEERN